MAFVEIHNFFSSDYFKGVPIHECKQAILEAFSELLPSQKATEESVVFSCPKDPLADAGSETLVIRVLPLDREIAGFENNLATKIKEKVGKVRKGNVLPIVYSPEKITYI